MRLENRVPDNIGELVDRLPFGRIYPSAVVSGRQSGEIFTDGRGVLIRHRCGFAWLTGEYGDDFLGEVQRLKTESEKRLVLFTDDERTVGFFAAGGAVVAKRRYFEYKGGRKDISVPEGFDVKELDAELFGRLGGRVVPVLFWTDAEQFLRSGKGFCLMKNGEPAAWAFSASSDGRELDIGVETAESFRGQGLASAAAELMINYALDKGLSPIWACDAANTASGHIAEKIGFVQCAECRLIK